MNFRMIDFSNWLPRSNGNCKYACLPGARSLHEEDHDQLSAINRGIHIMRTLGLLVSIALSTSLLCAQENWPEFRGPTGNGVVTATNLPLSWDGSKNVVWSTPIHDRGWSSPVVWENQVWLTTATRDGKKLFAICVDRESGNIIHDLEIFQVQSPQRITTENTYATPTPVVDRNHVYVHYGTYGTACLKRESGKVVWERRDLNCDHEVGAGPASSPMLFGNLFIVNVDGRDVQYVIALNQSDGETVWKTDRSVDYSKVPVNQRKAYGMPILVGSKPNRQLVSNGGKGIFSYDPLTGQERWRVQHHGFSQAPRPVFGHGLIFATVDRDNPELWAIRADGAGDVTDSHVVWKEKRAMPRRCSPLLIGNRLYLVARTGVITCLDAKTGQLAWRDRLPGQYSASPIYDSKRNRIYFFNEDAVTVVVKPADTLQVIATNRLPHENLMASPAVSGNSLFIRTESMLYRIQATPKKVAR